MESKKILSCALAVMLSLGTITALPEQFNDKLGIAITAEAASSDLIISTDSDGYKYVSGYKGNGGEVVIPADVSYVDEEAFKGTTRSHPSLQRVTFMLGKVLLKAVQSSKM